MRILVLIAIGLLLYVIIGNLLRKSRPPSPKEISEKMVQCQHCGLHVLEHEAIQSGSNYYCSQEHVDADK
ncbi:MAG: hypothetical protein GQ547_01460 [Methylophaga sp.]|nr:hypothetical protein [Methylophaga sp.]